MSPTQPLPPKKEVGLALLERSSVYVHLDPRQDAVVVPAWFKKQPQLVLQVGMNMPVPIPDLRLDDDGMSCTLSFNRAPFFCVVPWAERLRDGGRRRARHGLARRRPGGGRAARRKAAGPKRPPAKSCPSPACPPFARRATASPRRRRSASARASAPRSRPSPTATTWRRRPSRRRRARVAASPSPVRPVAAPAPTPRPLPGTDAQEARASAVPPRREVAAVRGRAHDPARRTASTSAPSSAASASSRRRRSSSGR